ncbi:alpha/beta hydrolase [Bradyrhizobium sp. Gha]|uniref:alpha/beta hydrolase family protein n=1 Tax=Bradyrhizobium sp. Gha TaxID=1855318 RepID=UPI0008E7D64D|nr:alpha/beta hydrolase [Bradyrhizobium sp. Gha]SFH64291.1 Serine aminopeptidase, S33 [Bradyrhizobium sp. Gha]
MPKFTKITAIISLVVSASSLLISPHALAQSLPDDEMFDPVKVINGLQISRQACKEMEGRQTAVWVSVEDTGYCLRYYAAGLKTDGQNSLAIVWMPGDVMGGPNGVRHQAGLGVAAMIEQSKVQSGRYGVPFIFLARPGTYGSAGKHYDVRHTPLEAKLMAAAIDTLKSRYGIASWVLGGHSGGGTLAAELLARRNDLQCVVLSSPAAAYRARLKARGWVSRLKTEVFFDPYDSLKQIPDQPARRIFLISDPRDSNIPFSTQELYFKGLESRGHAAWLVPLMKARGPTYHSLVDFGQAAEGMCADGVATDVMLKTLRAKPMESDRISN